MVDGPGSRPVAVRTIAQAGGIVWVGGLFDEIDGPAGTEVTGAADLAAFDTTTGLPVSGIHLPAVTSSTGAAELFDSSLGPNGNLYLAGRFDAVDGQARNGVAAIDPATGELLPFAPDPGAARTILAKAGAIYVAGKTLLSFRPDGTATPGFRPPKVFTDAALRTELAAAQFRDIAKRGNTLVAACQCDRLTDAVGTHDVKAVVELDATTGELLDWSPAGLGTQTQASGISLVVHDLPGTTVPTIYLAAGGNDFTAAYDFSTGAQDWREDTSGSSQAVLWYKGHLIVGGHFDWTRAPGGPTCGTNAQPNQLCLFTPKLVAMSASTGAVLPGSDGTPWNPGICCLYNGVWALMGGSGDGSTLNVGGQFTEAGGSWTCRQATASCLSGSTTQKYFARFAPT